MHTRTHAGKQAGWQGGARLGDRWCPPAAAWLPLLCTPTLACGSGSLPAARASGWHRLPALPCPCPCPCMQGCASSTTAKRWRMRSWAPARTPRPAACRMMRCRASARPTWQPRRPCGMCCPRAASGERSSTRDSAHAVACFAGVALQAGAPGRTHVAAGPCGLTTLFINFCAAGTTAASALRAARTSCGPPPWRREW